MQENSSFQSDNTQFLAQNTEKKEKANAFFLALWALGLTIAVSITFYALAFFTNSQISGKQSEIDSVKSKITILEADPTNSIAAIISNGNIKPSINLTELIKNFNQIAQRYEIGFQNFSIKDDSITSNLIAQNADKDAAQKIIAMMKEFAKAGQQGTFSLEPIFSISGDRTTRMTPVTFKIVPPKTQKAETPSAENNSENSSN